MEQRIDFAEAVFSQPRWLATAVGAASRALQPAPLDSAASPGASGGPPRPAGDPALTPPAPWLPGETVAVVGMGASTHAGTVFVEALRQAGVRAVNLDASAVADLPENFEPAENYVILSESGRSPEPLAAALRLSRAAPKRRLIVTNGPDSPITAVEGTVIPLGGFVDSGVYTIGYTCTLAVLAVVARACGVDLGDPADLPGAARQALDVFAAPAAKFARGLMGRRSLDIAGRGISYGGAEAAALLFREAASIPSAAFETFQYLHGPMESCSDQTAVLLFGDGGLEDGLTRQLAAGGALTQVVEAGFASGLGVAVAEAIFTQLVALELSRITSKRIGAWRFPRPDTKLPQP
jgi:fructoselysine-6-P-deglycase FrlB-like protein